VASPKDLDFTCWFEECKQFGGGPAGLHCFRLSRGASILDRQRFTAGGRIKSGMDTKRFFQDGCSVWRHPGALFLACLPLFALLSALSHAQATVIRIPTTIPLSIELLQHVPMKAGEALQGRLLYGIYVDNQLALPAGTIVCGRVVQLDSDRSRRIHSRLRGDFTPFHLPVVRFDQMVLPDGSRLAIASDGAKDGAPILSLSPPPGKKRRSFIGQQVEVAERQVKSAIALFTAPGRGDRLVQFVYGQLPYHPERIETGTAWTVALSKPLDLTFRPPENGGEKASKRQTAGAPAEPQDVEEWRLRAYLQRTISSTNDKPGDTFQAVVAEPVFNPQHDLVVPEGSVLVGEITQAKPARSFGRQGKLRFRFKELKLPSGFSQPVTGTLAGINSIKSANLEMDPEGSIRPQSQNRVIAPLVLILLAGRGFDDDGNQVLNSALAANGFGIVGRVVGMAASSRNVAGAIGVYGAAVSVYDLWLARGHNIVFEKNTRIEVTTRPNHNPLGPSANGQIAPSP
jgi:hypothetical protein